MGLLYLLFLIPFGFDWGVFVGVGSVLKTGLNRGERLGDISGPLFFTPLSGSVSYHFISFFLARILTSCCKAECFISPISPIGVVCEVFSKNFPILETASVIASVVDIQVILVDCEKIDCVFWSLFPSIWGVNLLCAIAIHKGSNVNPGTPWNSNDLCFTGF